ncbi:Flp pilus assembly complex ATPase component TadA, partial [bacterium]|nr:Flp pilus assembly complex ATPase component TadA [bacterium]
MGINIDGMLLELLTRNGSDLFITSKHAPTLRVNGMMTPLDMPVTSPEEVEAIVRDFVSDADFERLEEDLNIDFAHESRLPGFGVRRFRGCAFFQRLGLSIVLRTIPVQIPTCKELLLPESVMKLIDFHQGLVLVTGPTGSGKTTTLASLINHINNTRPLHVITIEDPIEFVYPVNKCMIVQRQVGTHVESFSAALRAALREDPDVILVGELRDLDTIQLAVTAAETGHLVLGTLHTLSAA